MFTLPVFSANMNIRNILKSLFRETVPVPYETSVFQLTKEFALCFVICKASKLNIPRKPSKILV